MNNPFLEGYNKGYRDALLDSAIIIGGVALVILYILSRSIPC